MSQQTCLICKRVVSPYSWNVSEPGAHIKCEVCGEYRLSERLATEIFQYTLPKSYIYSAAIREQYELGSTIWVEDLKLLEESVVVSKSPLESIDRILLYVLRKSKTADEWVRLQPTDYPIAFAKTPDEFQYFLSKAQQLNYLEHDNGQFRLTLDGWKHLAELPQKDAKLNQAFVAMWFSKEVEDAWEYGLKPALERTGYDAIRIDRTEHNDKIDDRIIAEIRKSGLLVADFTGHRGGVYFEAGFAMGLGITVIWSCRDTDIDKAHFDTRQYNHIVWNDAADLKEKLINRIEATLPTRHKGIR